jgi:RNA polymerase-binding transcription factor DksA
MQSLLEKKIQLQQRINAIETDFKKGRSQDFAEQTSENENNEVLNEIHHEAKIELTLINQALMRFENNEYGLCSQCTEAISPERLKILPYIDTCIDCAK